MIYRCQAFKSKFSRHAYTRPCSLRNLFNRKTIFSDDLKLYKIAKTSEENKRAQLGHQCISYLSRCCDKKDLAVGKNDWTHGLNDRAHHNKWSQCQQQDYINVDQEAEGKHPHSVVFFSFPPYYLVWDHCIYESFPSLVKPLWIYSYRHTKNVPH